MVRLGRIAHESLMRARRARFAGHAFAHGAWRDLGGLAVFDSHHSLRYNTNTGRLTAGVFEAVFVELHAYVDPA